MEAKLIIVTETWLGEGERLEELRSDLEHGSGLGMINKNKPPGQNGVTYGGVALLWKNSFANFKEVKFPNAAGHEVLVAAGSVRGHGRKLVMIAC